MSMIEGSRLPSPSELWAGREKQQGTARCELSWRQRGSQSPTRKYEERTERVGMIDLRKKMPLFGCEREQRLEASRKMYGDVAPAEKELRRMYKESKMATDKFITWLVETSFPDGKGLPSYVSRVPESSARDHEKYGINVNKCLTLADMFIETSKSAQMPFAVIVSLKKAISLRADYAFCMNLKSDKSQDAQALYENHLHFIDVLDETRRILSPSEKRTTKTSAEMTPLVRQNSALGKRKGSHSDLKTKEPVKAVKTEPSLLEAEPNPWYSGRGKITRQEPMGSWRQSLGNNSDKIDKEPNTWCEHIISKSCAPAIKSRSYAAALSTVSV